MLGDHGRNDFWCDNCKRDFTDYSAREDVAGGERIWRADCPRGHKLVRLIGNAKDPYFLKSEKLRRERKEFWKDLIQPDHPAFSLYYKDTDPNESWQEEMMRREKAKWEQRRGTMSNRFA